MSPSPLTSNESKIRLTAFFVLLLVIAYLLTGIAWIMIFLVVDFSFRATPELARYSPLGAISGLLVRLFRLPVKPVYMPPKRFAARIGLLFWLGLIISYYSPLATLILGSIIALFAALESLAGICAGCYVYNWMIRLRGRHTA
jgi:hypothetical protein